MGGAGNVTRLEIPSRSGWEQIAAWVARQVAREAGFSEARSADVATALAEACLNAIEHANRYEPARPVTITFGWSTPGEPPRLWAHVRDRGRRFRPPEGPPSLEEAVRGTGPARGWGIHLIRCLADRAVFRHVGTGNVVELVFTEEGRAS